MKYFATLTKTLTIALFFFAPFACKKSHTTHTEVTIRVVDVAGNPVEGWELYLQYSPRSDSSDIPFENTHTTIDTQLTDNTGTARFEYEYTNMEDVLDDYENWWVVAKEDSTHLPTAYYRHHFGLTQASQTITLENLRPFKVRFLRISNEAANIELGAGTLWEFPDGITGIIGRNFYFKSWLHQTNIDTTISFPAYQTTPFPVFYESIDNNKWFVVTSEFSRDSTLLLTF